MSFEILASLITTISTSFSGLLAPAAAFFFLALLVKKSAAFDAIKLSWRNGLFNLAILALNAVILAPLIPMIWTLLQTNVLYDGSLWLNLPSAAVVFCAVFIGDFVGYWRHRLEHSRFLWPSHSVHHSDSHMTWLTLQRFHPLNRLSTYIIDSGVLLALGFPIYAILVNSFVRHYYGYFIHADLPWTYGKWSWIFVSPVMHRWHHAEEQAAHHTNYATVFSIFDRAFGTYRVPGNCDVPLGVAYMRNKNLLQQLAYPFKPSAYVKFKKPTQNLVERADSGA